MEEGKRIARWGSLVILFAVFLRILGVALPWVQSLPREYLFTAALFLQTGKLFYGPQSPQAAETVPTEPAATPAPTVPPAPEKPTFSAADLENIRILYGCDQRPDPVRLLTSPLQWNLTAGEPAVLIVHTHATECYSPAEGEDFLLYDSYRTLDNRYNMVSVGAEIARVLSEGGIGVVHDTTLHDYPDYNAAYGNTRQTIESYLAQYPSIRVVLDVHRDAGQTQNGQLSTGATVGGQESAQIMLVVGTKYDTWQENTALALKLSVLMERADPGITRPVYLRKERFNMDLTPGSLIVEVGAAGDSHAQALLAADAFARSVLTLLHGSG